MLGRTSLLNREQKCLLSLSSPGGQTPPFNTRPLREIPPPAPTACFPSTTAHGFSSRFSYRPDVKQHPPRGAQECKVTEDAHGDAFPGRPVCTGHVGPADTTPSACSRQRLGLSRGLCCWVRSHGPHKATEAILSSTQQLHLRGTPVW